MQPGSSPLELRWALLLKGSGPFHPVLCRTQESIEFRLHFQALFEGQLEAADDGLLGILDS
jgi:hypothetical protein